MVRSVLAFLSDYLINGFSKDFDCTHIQNNNTAITKGTIYQILAQSSHRQMNFRFSYANDDVYFIAYALQNSRPTSTMSGHIKLLLIFIAFLAMASNYYNR